jgi:DNA-binding transcriptional LysR family regulator
MLTAYLNRGGGGNTLIRAFADGVGCPLRYAEDEVGYRPGVPVVWGVLRGSDRVLSHARAHGQYFFYCDHAYVDRGHGRRYRITRNGYEAGRVRACPDDRLAELGLKPEPWRRGGRSILICPPTGFFMAAHGCQGWLERTLEVLRAHTDRPLVIREKPRPGELVQPLQEALLDAHALVCHSSNVAIEAVLAGVPVFVAPTSAAAPVGLTDLQAIEAPMHPDRRAWLAHLAYSQFSLEEIASGKAWQLLLECEERPFL